MDLKRWHKADKTITKTFISIANGSDNGDCVEHFHKCEFIFHLSHRSCFSFSFLLLPVHCVRCFQFVVSIDVRSFVFVHRTILSGASLTHPVFYLWKINYCLSHHVIIFIFEWLKGLIFFITCELSMWFEMFSWFIDSLIIGDFNIKMKVDKLFRLYNFQSFILSYRRLQWIACQTLYIL